MNRCVIHPSIHKLNVIELKIIYTQRYHRDSSLVCSYEKYAIILILYVLKCDIILVLDL